MACKPDSVATRVADGHSSGPAVADGLVQPTRIARAGEALGPCAPRDPYSALLLAGLAVPPTLPPARWALTPPFHPCPAAEARRAVCSLWRFPSGHPGRALPAAISPWSPDFPRPLQAAAVRPSARAPLMWEAARGQRKPRAPPGRPPRARARSPTGASAAAPPRAPPPSRRPARRSRRPRPPRRRPASRRRPARAAVRRRRPGRRGRGGASRTSAPGRPCGPGAMSEWAMTPAGGIDQRARMRVEQALERRHLRLGERREAGERAGVGELDADRARVDVAAARPSRRRRRARRASPRRPARQTRPSSAIR